MLPQDVHSKSTREPTPPPYRATGTNCATSLHACHAKSGTANRRVVYEVGTVLERETPPMLFSKRSGGLESNDLGESMEDESDEDGESGSEGEEGVMMSVGSGCVGLEEEDEQRAHERAVEFNLKVLALPMTLLCHVRH